MCLQTEASTEVRGERRNEKHKDEWRREDSTQAEGRSVN